MRIYTREERGKKDTRNLHKMKVTYAVLFSERTEAMEAPIGGGGEA